MADAKPLLSIEFPPTDVGAWRTMVERALGAGAVESKLVTHTLEGIAVRPLYTAADAAASGEGEAPGVPPYRRGAEPIGRWSERRDLRSAIANPDHDAARGEIDRDLKHAARSLWLRFDAGARLGREDAGVVRPGDLEASGLACVSAAQLAALLDGVAFDRVPVALDAGGNALPAAALWVAAARARGIAADALHGSLCADPLGALARDGALPCSLAVARAQLVALARWTSTRAPGLRAACVSSLAYHEAGAHAAQELACTLATGVAYLRWLVDAGMPVDAATGQIEFRVAVASDVFMEIAKLRALRWLWAEIVRAAGGSDDAARAPIHAVTSPRTRTRRDPWVNMVRDTTQAFAAHVGGADAVTTTGFDALWGPSDPLARRIALNAQVLLDEEAHVTRVADPAGGSWYAEALTDALARAAWEAFSAIEREGGMQGALASGRAAREIDEVARTRLARIAGRELAIIGVNEFALPHEEPLVRPPPDAKQLAAARRAWLDRARADAPTLSALRTLAGADRAEVVDAAIETAAAGASLSAITAALAGSDAPATLAALPLRRDAAAHDDPAGDDPAGSRAP